MTKIEIQKIAENANMIIKGYAFTYTDGNVRVLNLHHPESAMLFTTDGKMLETNMDEIEQALVLNIWKTDSEYMSTEHSYA